jgi:hypothetical protein
MLMFWIFCDFVFDLAPPLSFLTLRLEATMRGDTILRFPSFERDDNRELLRVPCTVRGETRLRQPFEELGKMRLRTPLTDRRLSGIYGKSASLTESR